MSTHVLTDKETGFQFLLRLRKAANDSVGSYLLDVCFLGFLLNCYTIKKKKKDLLCSVLHKTPEKCNA